MTAGLVSGPTGDAADPSAATAVEQAVHDHARLVYRIAFAVLRDHHDAEDATQEVFLRLLRLRRDLEGVRDRKAWLARVAFRVAAGRRPRRRLVSVQDEDAAPALVDLRDPAPPLDEAASSAQLQALLGRAIAALPDDLRSTVELSTLRELGSAEVGAILDVPEGTVRTRLMRARRLLRRALSPHVGGRRDG